MPSEKISQLPPAIAVSGSNDYLEIAHFVGAQGYVSQKITPIQFITLIAGFAGVAAFTTGQFTLNANATSTAVLVAGCKPTSTMPTPCPITAHAANDMGTTSYTMQTGQFTVTLANNSRTDRTFMYLLFF